MKMMMRMVNIIMRVVMIYADDNDDADDDDDHDHDDESVFAPRLPCVSRQAMTIIAAIGHPFHMLR